MTESPFRVLAVTIFGILVLAIGATVLAQDTVPKISKEDVKSMLGNPEVVVIDVRLPREWETSTSKIKGAVREEPANFDTWANKYPKDKTLILYCA